MIVTIRGRNVPEAYSEGLWQLKVFGIHEDSRNGPVITIPHPVVLEITHPVERVLFDVHRDANPFFHVMEFVWMMAGSRDAAWISQFNKRMMEYADDGYLRGAYGWRWQNPINQIAPVISLLRSSPETRQAVLSMWDPSLDGPEARSSDRPCNTHIYFRRNSGNPAKLDMTVCNRSNDFFWGMLGSNAVHFTMLHEFIALASDFRVGTYRVFTNNLHVYTEMPRFEELYTASRGKDDRYDEVTPFPLLAHPDEWQDLIRDCEILVNNLETTQRMTRWMMGVAYPMYQAYLNREARDGWIVRIGASDWNLACSEWNLRRQP